MRLSPLLPLFVSLALAACVAKENEPIETRRGIQELKISGVIAEDLCAVGVRCRNLKPNSCLNSVNKLEGLPDAMGAPHGKYRTVNDLIVGLENKQVAVNESALDLCRSDLRKLMCGDDLVQHAFGKTSDSVEEIDFLLRANALCEKLIRQL